MSFSRLALPLCLCLAGAAPALAETSAEEVLAFLRDGVAVAGGTFTASESRRGDRLILSRVEIAVPDGTRLVLPDITLRENADLSVAVELPPRFPLVLDLPASPGEPDKLTLQVAAPDLAITLRDLGPAVAASLRAGSLSATLDKLDLPPQVAAPPDLFLALAVADLALDWQHSADPQQDGRLNASLSLGTLHAETRADIPDEALKFSMALDASSLAALLEGLVPAANLAALQAAEAGPDPSPMEVLAFLDGALFKASARLGSLGLALDAPVSPDGPIAMELSQESSALGMTLDRNGLLYEITSGTANLHLRGQMPDMPVEQITIAIASGREMLRLGFPSPQVASPDWGIAYSISGLTVSEDLWSLFDARRVIPRDPIGLTLGLSGTYALDARLLAPGPAWTPGPEDNPFTALTVDLTDVRAQGAGLTFTGTGGVALDFTQEDPMLEGAPLAKGKLSFLTTGLNGLIDRLLQIGVIRDGDLSSLRLGLMFIGRAVPGQSDQLSTELEFDGPAFSLNGQRIR